MINGWKECRLGDLVKINYGKGLSEQKRKTGNIPVFSSAGITGWHDSPLVNNNGIIIGRKGTVGTVYYSDKPFYCIDTAYYIEPCEPKYDIKYLYYLLRTMGLTELNEDSAVPGLNRNTAYAQEIALPTLPEQRAIAGVLSSLDDKIDLLHRQNKTLEGLAEAIFEQKFMSGQENWPLGRLSEHIQIFRGLSYHGAGLCGEGEGKPMHNLNSVLEGGGYKYSGIKYYKGEYKERHLVKPGDIIVTNTEQGHNYLLIGYPARVPKLFGDSGIFTQHIYKVTLKPDSPLSNIFLYYLLKNQKIWKQVIGGANGSTVNMLAMSGLETVEFNVPPIEEITKYTKFASQTLEKQEHNIIVIRTLSRLRDSLLPKLMSGEVRVNYSS